MQPLKTVISALRREIESALEGNRDLPVGARLEAERVVLSLEFMAREQHRQDGSVEVMFDVINIVAQSSTDGNAVVAHCSPHRLTIEFTRAQTRPLDTEKHSLPQNYSARSEEGVETNPVTKSLIDLLGAPGFDSSARATVLRETLAGLSEGQIRAVVASLAGGDLPDANEAVKRARHLIKGVLRSGPLKSAESGGKVLEEIFGRQPVESVLRLIQETWKSEEQWTG
jgi:hypothetical protein